MSSRDGTSELNKYLQGKRQLADLSWGESKTGPREAPTWTLVCKIKGEERGRGTGSSKMIARNKAAEAALQSLIEESA